MVWKENLKAKLHV
ncbi:unnamed protein product, partial [Allacma fusca]